MLKINVRKFIPKKLDHRDVFIREENGFLQVYCNKIKPPRPITVSKYLNLNNFLLEIIGLYSGDGNNKNSGSANRRVAFSNTCYGLHKNWIKFLDNLGIDKQRLNVQIQKGINVKKFDYEIIRHWSFELDLPLSCFTKKVSVKKCNTKDFGLAVVNFNNKLFRKIFENILVYCFNIVEKNKLFASSFLRGLFAAEGYPALNKYGSIMHLDIPMKDERLRSFVSNLFDYIGIRCSNNQKTRRIIITGYLNFKKFRELNLHIMHPERFKRFEKGYKNLIENGNVPSLTKLKIINYLNIGPKTRFEVARALSLNLSTVYKSLKDLELKGIIQCFDKSLSKNDRKLRHRWELTGKPVDSFYLMSREY